MALGACGGGDDGTTTHENCSTVGDEDGNGLADCADPACASTPACSSPVCGNGTMETGEQCDDGNTMAGDGCSPTCKTEVCGNGVMDPDEECDDGNQVDGDGCDTNCKDSGCGNGVMDPSEQCDDGNTTDGDGCDHNCKTTACGNGVMTSGEACDDGNATDGDGCDSNCTPTGCGNGIVTSGEQCDDGNQMDGDGCTMTCMIMLCGNGHLDPGEGCDDGNQMDGDGCDVDCTPTGCGNGHVSPGETCDDGNTTNADGCSAQCILEPTEMEPNDDGMPTVGASFAGTTQNDIDATAVMNADGNTVFDAADGSPMGSEVHVLAMLSPAGDEDLFKFQNTTAIPFVARFDTYDLTVAGFGNPCPDANGVDTVMRLYDNTATSVALNDDRDGGTDRCSGLTVTFPANSSGYIGISFYDDDTEIAAPGYALKAVWTPDVCGDGVVSPAEACDDGNMVNGDGCDNNCTMTACGNGIMSGTELCDDGNMVNGDGCDNNCTMTGCGNGVQTAGETCDDGNTAPGDGCDAMCHVEGVTVEVEPNDTTANADTNPVQITNDAMIQGSLSAATDLDNYRLTIAVGTVIRAETLTGLNPEDCVGGTQDLLLLNSTGTTIIQDTGATGGGIGNCGGLVIYLDPGTYYLRVKNSVVTANYFLKVDFQDAKGPETEAANMMGVNDTNMMAETLFGTAATTGAWVSGDHTLQADSDFYAITVPANARVRAEIIEGDRATETCENDNIDSELTLYDQNGVQLITDDDDGRGFCSLIDGRGTTPNDALAKNTTGMTQTWYLQVRQSHTISTVTTAGQFVYRLSVDIH
ncbi:MAG TPA: DUF4215 domain-containing protein [Kofleriaceae bacterium]|nr:DUF4215 domain-containing protein [Kofleriaceae bacterium]